MEKKHIRQSYAPYYVPKTYPQMILASRFDYTLSHIKYLLPLPLCEDEVLCIPTAAYAEEDHSWLYPQDINPLELLGISPPMFDIVGKSEKEVRERLQGIRILIVPGGNTFYLLKHMRKCGFEQILKERLKEDLIFLASSAGAVICSPDISYITPMDEPPKEEMSTKGFNLVPFQIIPHYNSLQERKMAEKIFEEESRKGNVSIALNDEQFLHITGHTIRIV